LPVVDPMGSYSHGYIRTDGKKEDTYYNQGCMRQILNMFCNNSAQYLLKISILSFCPKVEVLKVSFKYLTA
jgi:hypothetical protein